MSADPHFGFVVAAYLIGFLVVAGMIAAIVKDYANLKHALAKFSPGEAPRGSAGAASRQPIRREIPPGEADRGIADDPARRERSP